MRTAKNKGGYMLKVKNIFKSYTNNEILNDINLKVKKGQIVGLLGSNGAGKSTLFHIILGIISNNNGEVYLENESISKLPLYKRAKKGIAFLPQENSIFRNLTVYENLKLICEMNEVSFKKIDYLLSEFEIGDLKNRKGNELSGGEKRRVEIARSLLTNPSYILLDEPFAAIDPIAVNDIKNIIKQLKMRNIGVLITDHNVQETLSITDYSYILDKGKIIFSGTSNQILDNEKIKNIYLGKNFKIN